MTDTALTPIEFGIYLVNYAFTDSPAYSIAQFVKNPEPEEEGGSDSHCWLLFGDEEMYPVGYFSVLKEMMTLDEVMTDDPIDLKVYGHCPLVTTYSSAKELQDAADNFNGSEAAIAHTMALAGWNTALQVLKDLNLLRPIVEQKEEKKCQN